MVWPTRRRPRSWCPTIRTGSAAPSAPGPARELIPGSSVSPSCLCAARTPRQGPHRLHCCGNGRHRHSRSTPHNRSRWESTARPSYSLHRSASGSGGACCAFVSPRSTRGRRLRRCSPTTPVMDSAYWLRSPQAGVRRPMCSNHPRLTKHTGRCDGPGWRRATRNLEVQAPKDSPAHGCARRCAMVRACCSADRRTCASRASPSAGRRADGLVLDDDRSTTMSGINAERTAARRAGHPGECRRPDQSRADYRGPGRPACRRRPGPRRPVPACSPHRRR
jgi:hypothetical protein